MGKLGSGIPNVWLFLTAYLQSRDIENAQYTFWPLTWAECYFRRYCLLIFIIALCKLQLVNREIGARDSKNVIIIGPLQIGHVILRMRSSQ